MGGGSRSSGIFASYRVGKDVVGVRWACSLSSNMLRVFLDAIASIQVPWPALDQRACACFVVLYVHEC